MRVGKSPSSVLTTKQFHHVALGKGRRLGIANVDQQRNAVVLEARKQVGRLAAFIPNREKNSETW
jgi:hypothetical protein